MKTTARFLVLVAWLCAAPQVFAAVIVYTDRATFLAATTTSTNIDFDGIAAPGGFVGYGPGPLSLSGVTFTSNEAMFVIDPGFYGFPYPSAFLNSDFDNPNIITAVIPSGLNAVGFDFGALFSGGGTTSFDVTLSTGDAFTVTSNGSTQDGFLDFAGFISTNGSIASLSISMPDAPDYNAIDNFVIGTAPTPGSLALLGLSLAGLGFIRRRKA